jgi:hypothetical protein
MRHDPPGKLFLGLLTGVAFGAILYRGRVARHEVIIDQLQLRDFTVAKVMATAVAVSAAAIHWLQRRGRTRFDVKPLQLGGIAAGGVLFGAGLAVLGYCPGTTLAAVGAGNKDAVAGVAGMFLGATAFVSTYSGVKPFAQAMNAGKVRIPELLAR